MDVIFIEINLMSKIVDEKILPYCNWNFESENVTLTVKRRPSISVH